VRRPFLQWLASIAFVLGASAVHGQTQTERAPPPPANEAHPEDGERAKLRAQRELRRARRNAAQREAAERGAVERYERERWPHWTDADGDCQNTRHELLIALSLAPVTFKARRPCQVRRGRWRDAYTGEIVANADKLDVDHVVPLAEAYRSGGFRWPDDKRRAFANDLSGLVLTRRALNRAKADQDPATWLPPNPALHCDYVRLWIAIKQRWALETDAHEREALLGACR
jgi:Protein of unknown function (DUF1524)